MINFLIPPKERPTIVAVKSLLKSLDVLCEAARSYAVETQEEEILMDIEEICTDFEKKIQDYCDQPGDEPMNPTVYDIAGPLVAGKLG